MTRRPTTRRTPGRGLQVVGPDGLPPAVHQHDADPVDEPGSVPDPPSSGEPRVGEPRVGARPADGPAGVEEPLAVPGPARGPRITVPARPGARPRTRAAAPARAPAPPGPGALAAAARRDRTRAEGFLPEDPLLADMRARSQERDLVPAAVGTSATLSFLAAALRARSVVEIGTGLGVGTVSLLRGMPPEGLLTSVDVEPEYQRLARLGTVAAGFAPNRVRMISGAALDVLPRLSDRSYDLVVVDADPLEYAGCLDEAVRLLRSGGVVVLVGMLGQDRAPEPGRGDPDRAAASRRPADVTAAADVAAAVREAGRAVREDERLVPVMLPVSEGLLCAAVR